jgi:hypothetical protein
MYLMGKVRGLMEGGRLKWERLTDELGNFWGGLSCSAQQLAPTNFSKRAHRENI